MDKASDYESGDSRFKSWQGRNILEPIILLIVQIVARLSGILNSKHAHSAYVSFTYVRTYSIMQTTYYMTGPVAQWIRHLTTN